MRISDWSSDVCSSDLSIDTIISCVTEDAELDYSAFGYGSYRGHDVITSTFVESIFPMTEWGVHQVTNFHVTETDGDTAKGLAYLGGKVSLKGNDPMQVPAECDYVFQIGSASCRERVGQYV